MLCAIQGSLGARGLWRATTSLAASSIRRRRVSTRPKTQGPATAPKAMAPARGHSPWSATVRALCNCNSCSSMLLRPLYDQNRRSTVPLVTGRSK